MNMIIDKNEKYGLYTKRNPYCKEQMNLFCLGSVAVAAAKTV